MRYTDLILKDFPISVYPLDEQISGTSNQICYSTTDTSSTGLMNGEYIYNSGWKAENKGLPLVFGGDDGTYLFDNAGQPSLTIPRMNCFSKTSTYTDSTLEFWLKISNSTDQEVKILGVDDDGLENFGLYAYKNYLIFKINNDSFIAAPIQTWSIQHHIAIVYSYSGVALICDGTKYYPFIKESTQIGFGDDKNFLFYGSSSIDSVVIDAVALYKYGLSEQNCKRHMVYALGFGFSGTPFSRNNGVFVSFENSNSKKVDDIIMPMNDQTEMFDSNNVIVSNRGIQLSNTDKIFYAKNHSENADFYFTNSSNLTINSLSNYAEDNFGIGINFTINSSGSVDEEYTLFFVDGTSNTGDIQVVYLNGNLYLRVYSIDKIVSDPKYYEEDLGTISVGTEYLFGILVSGNQYDIYLNDSHTSYTDIPSIELDEESSLYVGSSILLSDTEEQISYLSNGFVRRVTIFKNETEFEQVINDEPGNLSRFNIYYENATLTFNERIRLHRKGSIGFDISMDALGRSVWDGIESKSCSGGVKIEHLYPEITSPEILITINRYDGENTTEESTQIISSQIEMLSGIDHTVDLSDRWMSVDVDFDSDDCLYFPPILGQISLISNAKLLTSEEERDYDVSLEYSNFEKTIKVNALDSLPHLEEQVISPIALGENSGINISGLPVEYVYDYSSGSQDGQDESGIKTISFFAKRNNSDTSKKIIEWQEVGGTPLPTSASAYIDGVPYGVISLTRPYILWSDISVEDNIWYNIVIVFNTPIIYQDSTKTYPSILFGDSSNNSNISIQHLGTSEIEFTEDMILSAYKLFTGQNILSVSSDSSISIYETVGGVQIYSNNWQRIA